MNEKALKILHIAPQNFAGMPMDFVYMHRKAGFNANLVTLYPNIINFDEDISLNLHLPSGNISNKWRSSKISEIQTKDFKLKYYESKNFLEDIFFKFRDFKNSKIIHKAIIGYNLLHYDIYHFDGGMDLFRDCRFLKQIKMSGKKIVSCYFGSDLRTRGIFREIDEASDLVLTVEFDHKNIYKNINYLFFPFDVTEFQEKNNFNDIPKIIHSPTNRLYKGTNKILEVINELKKEVKFEFLLIENTERNELLKLKNNCDIAIDQVGGELGGSGYGKNSIENLAMGLPTITEFSDDYLDFLKENPFVHSTIDTLKNKLKELILNKDLRIRLSNEGRNWVKKYHSFESVNNNLMKLYQQKGII